jgi:uncharacterized RDD family membrane protein YckC
LGALIDYLIFLSFVLLAGIVRAAIHIAIAGSNQPLEAPSPWQMHAISCALFLVLHGYLLATRGQTIGKYLLGMQIVSADGRLVPFWRLIALRYLPFWVVTAAPRIGWILSLANALAIFRESRKCFHDDIAGTKVIQL